MGDLVAMSRPKLLPARGYLDGHSAEILFFTGVRYYRMDKDEATGAAPAARAARKRRPAAKGPAERSKPRARRLEALA